MSSNNIVDKDFKYVCQNAKYVHINYKKVDEIIDLIRDKGVSCWIDSNPYGILDLDINYLILLLFIYHAIGDYCLWGDPKWQIITDDGPLDGTYAIIYIISKRFKQNKNFDMSYEEFKDFIEGNVQIPLLDDRYNNLKILYEFINSLDKSLSSIILNMKSDTELLEYLINNLSFFDDKTSYKGKTIHFYKRAQLLASDIIHVINKKLNKNMDYSHLIGCADYKIPQVMRCYGMLEFEDSLASKVDNKIEIKENSEEEIEIRASDLMVIDYIYEKLNRKYARMDINDFIWLLGQDKTKMSKPYHRTITNHY